MVTEAGVTEGEVTVAMATVVAMAEEFREEDGATIPTTMICRTSTKAATAATKAASATIPHNIFWFIDLSFLIKIKKE